MNKQIFRVDESEAGIRIDSYLSGVYNNLSRTKIQELIKSKLVTINSKICKPSYNIHTDDEILCNFEKCSEDTIIPEKIALDIRYENDNYAVINKPSGMLTHPTSKEKTGTLVNALLYKYGDTLSDINGTYRRGIIHRLDRNTSGLLIIAKNNDAHEKLANLIKERNIEKRYRTIVRGIIDTDRTIDAPISRSKTNPNKMCVSPDGKPSLTEIKVIEILDNATYLDVNLKTGRTHQIRVHLSHIGHPVFNDTLYGFGKMKIKTEEQVLQSYKVRFNDPFNNEDICVEINPDDKIIKVLDYIKKRGSK